MKRTIETRFLGKVRKTEACWLWVGGISTASYGNFHVYGMNWTAHRYAYELYVAKITDASHVLHKCDNRRCVNPEHLYLGTHADNMRDTAIRNRHPPQHGELNYAAKLTNNQVDEIRVTLTKGVRGGVIAKLFNVSDATISTIKHNKIRNQNETNP